MRVLRVMRAQGLRSGGLLAVAKAASGWGLVYLLAIGVTVAVCLRPQYGALVLALAIAVGVLFAVPLRFVLPSALAASALLPAFYTPLPYTVRLVAPAVVGVAVWLLRSLRSGRLAVPGWWVLLSAATACWLLFKLADTLRFTVSLAWSAQFALLVLAAGFAVVTGQPQIRETLLRTWLWLGLLLGLAGIAEAAIGANPLEPIYRAANSPLYQAWSVYRITTTLGHPLMNGLFFAIAATMAVMVAADSSRPRGTRRVAAACAGAAGVAVTLTVSRSAILGLIIGLIVGFLVIVMSRTYRLGAKVALAIAGAVAAVAAWNSPLIAARSASAEGSGSAQYRSQVLDQAAQAMSVDNYLGSGAATSAFRYQSIGATRIVENSWVQIPVSLGVVGAALVGLLLIGLLFAAARRRRPEAAAGLAAFIVVAAGFDVIDSNPTALALLGFLVVLVGEPASDGPVVPTNRELVGTSMVGYQGATRRPS